MASVSKESIYWVCLTAKINQTKQELISSFVAGVDLLVDGRHGRQSKQNSKLHYTYVDEQNSETKCSQPLGS